MSDFDNGAMIAELEMEIERLQAERDEAKLDAQSAHQCWANERTRAANAEAERDALTEWSKRCLAAEAERDAAVARAEKWAEEAARNGTRLFVAEADRYRLSAALTECADDLDDACKYKGEYLLGKHGDAENVARYRAIAANVAASGNGIRGH